MPILLELQNIECRYGANIAVEDLSIQIEKGDLVCLLGPSGCGKSTILRSIAGLEPIYAGKILLHNQVFSANNVNVPPEKRNIGMVFQDYALFPHLSVMHNVCFGLHKQSRKEKQKIGEDLLHTVGLSHHGKRYPHELSGGEQQRVALARALATKPKLILMDEPFSNLDIDLRERLSLEVRDILKAHQITGILVTHDQGEAFAVSDKIAILREGCLQQWDTAYNLYHDPQNRFVANFIGQGVFLTGTLLDPQTISTELGQVSGDRRYDLPPGTQLDILIRPDDILPDASNKLVAKIIKKAFKGAEIIYTLQFPTGTKVLSSFPSHNNHTIGDEVGIRIDLQHLIGFPQH